MPVLAQIRDRFEIEKPLSGVRIGACLHVTTETANLMLALQAGGAEIALCASNPLSTQDDVAAALCDYGIPTFAIKGEDNETYYYGTSNRSSRRKPQMSMDDGCDLVTTIYTKHNALLDDMIGGCEETTTGVIRLKAMQKDGVLPYPGRRGQQRAQRSTCSTTVTAPASRRSTASSARPTSCWPGRTLVVVGYGWCGRGIASRAAGMGAHVVVTEVDPRKAIEAQMDGYPRHADGRRGQDRRHLRHGHRQLSRDSRRALQTDEGRRDRLQLGPLQRRARPRRHQAH